MTKKGKPVQVAESVELVIDDLAYGGDSVARIEGYAVFLPGGIPGERVRARITELKKNYARAELEEVLEPSSYRRRPRCDVFEECGGCQLQHINYGAQLDYKTEMAEDSLRRLGGLECGQVRRMKGSPRQYYYRNKAQFALGEEGDFVAAGFYRRGTHRLVAPEECVIQDQEINEILLTVLELIVECGLSIYDERTGRGLCRHVVIRRARTTGEALVVLVINAGEFPEESEFAEKLMEREDLRGVLVSENRKQTNVIFGERDRLLAGKKRIREYLGDTCFLISARSFFQVNTLQAKSLYEKVLAFGSFSPEDRILDAYCGTGTIGLYLSDHVGEIIGIETEPSAVEDARLNARENGVEKARFIEDDVLRGVEKLTAQGQTIDKVIIDPPRRGCSEEALSALSACGPERIIYISCNPTTLARDLKYLDRQGYRFADLQPVDMFPQTAHVESVALLVSRGT